MKKSFAQAFLGVDLAFSSSCKQKVNTYSEQCPTPVSQSPLNSSSVLEQPLRLTCDERMSKESLRFSREMNRHISQRCRESIWDAILETAFERQTKVKKEPSSKEDILYADDPKCDAHIRGEILRFGEETYDSIPLLCAADFTDAAKKAGKNFKKSNNSTNHK